MTRPAAYILYGLAFTAWAAHFTLERSGVHVPVVHGALDDLLCMPLILFPLLLLFRLRTGPLYIFPAIYLILTWVALCFVFEGIVPLRDPRFTADAWDLLLYGIGGIVFWYMQQPFARPAELGKV